MNKKEIWKIINNIRTFFFPTEEDLKIQGEEEDANYFAGWNDVIWFY